uniref:TPR domain-containing protein n=2 Tax=Colletotrichum fructicola (strain Nara gc5) TaxID=1213859 RepID=L2G533_COLFN
MSTQKQPRRFALLIGIDCYLAGDARRFSSGHCVSINNLEGCVNDVNIMKKVLNNDFRIPNPTLLTSPPSTQGAELPTFAGIEKAFEHIYDFTESGDIFFFYFSGHGARLRPISVSPTGAAFDPSLLPMDFCLGQPAIRGWQLNQWLQKFSHKQVQVLAIIDSCHVAGSEESGERYRTPLNWDAVNLLPQDELAVRDIHSAAQNQPSPQTSWSMYPETFTLMAACEDDESTAEMLIDGSWVGVFTKTIADIFRTSGADEGSLTYCHLKERLARRLRAQQSVVHGQDRLLFLGDGRSYPRSHLIAWFQDGKVHLPIGKAHGVHSSSEFIPISAPSRFAFRMDHIEDFYSMVQLQFEVCEALARDDFRVVAFRWSLGSRQLRVSYDATVNSTLQEYILHALKCRISSAIEFAATSHSDKRRSDSLHINQQPHSGVFVQKPTHLVGYEGLAHDSSISSNTIDHTAEKVAEHILRVSRFEQALQLRDNTSPGPRPFEVLIQPLHGLSSMGPFPHNQQFVFRLHSECEEDLFFTLMNFSPGFGIRQGFPEDGFSARLGAHETIAFPFTMNMADELKIPAMINEEQVIRDIVRIIVVQGGEVSWKSLEQPNVWSSGQESRGQTQYRDCIVADKHRKWWMVDEEIITITDGLKAPPQHPPRHALGFLDERLKQVMQRFRLGCQLYLSFSRTGNIEDINHAIREIRHAVADTTGTGKEVEVMRATLGEIGFSLSQQSANTESAEYLKIAVEATKASGLCGVSREKLLNQLGSLLGRLFKCTEDPATLEEAIRVTKEAASSTNGNYLEQATALINLCNRLSERFKYTGLLSHLDDAIDFGREAMEKTQRIPQYWNIQTSIAANLGLSLCDRFSVTGRNEDLDEGINLCAVAVLQASPTDPNRALWLNNLGLAHNHQYSVSNNMNDLDEAIRVTQDALTSIHPRHPARSGIIFNLASRLRDRSRSTGSIEDLNEAVRYFRDIHVSGDAGNLPSQKIEISKRLSLLGISLGERFEKTHQRTDIEESVNILKMSLAAQPEGSTERGVRLQNVANALRLKFELLRDVRDIEEAISLRRQVLQEKFDFGLNREELLESMVVDLHLKAMKTKSLVDLEQAIQGWKQTIASASEGQSEKASRLERLAMVLYTRFQVTGDTSNLDEAVNSCRNALSVAMSPSDCIDIRRTLSICLSARASHTGAMKDTDDCIKLSKETLADSGIQDSDRRIFLSCLGSCFEIRHSNTGSMDDLNQSIHFNRQSVDILPADDDHKPSEISNLATALQTRFQRTGQMIDINEAIRLLKELIYTRPGDVEDETVFRTNLAGLLAERYIRTSNMHDIDEAIELARQTIPYKHANRPSRLNNLAGLLQRRYNYKKQPEDLTEAVQFSREAALTMNNQNPNHAALLSNLAIVLSEKHRISMASDDLDEAIRFGKEAVEKTRADHPERAKRTFFLGLDLEHRHAHSRDLDDLETAKKCHLEALHTTNSGANVRIHAGHRFMSICDIAAQHEEAFSAAETVVALIPLMASLSLQPADKQHFLSQVVGHTSDAAAIALAVGKCPASAVELLETGRGVISSTLQDLRADVTTLAKFNPELAGRFVEIRNKLDAPMVVSSRKADFPIQSHDRIVGAFSFEGDQRHEASGQLSDLLTEIRDVPGFDRFLLAGTEMQMREAAAGGPIIIINVGAHRRDALVIDQKGIRALELSGLSIEDIHSRSNTLDSVKTLEWLWDVAVGPILDFLGFTGTPGEGMPWPRVWWIPTGALVRFPLHAAGYHLRRNSDTAMDRVISSYSSSVKAITNARRQRLLVDGDPESGSNAILVSMSETPKHSSLQHAKREIDEVSKICSSMGLPFEHPENNNRDVLNALDNCKIFHFAGHGGTHPTDPLKSLLLLKDYDSFPLTVGSLLDKNLQSKRPFLAYLSACGTGEIKDKNSVDESIHLTSAFQLAGFQHVVGTLWSVDDAVCVDVARATYEAIQEHGFKDTSGSTTLANMTIIEIEVIFDFVCAWCYIGKRKLDHAISLYQKTYPGGKKDTFSITWKPYYLHYNPHPHSVDKSEVAKVRLSGMSPERQAALTLRMEQIGRSVGVNFKWGGKIGPDTRDAHRLVRLSRSEDASVQSTWIDGLFAAYHKLEQDISDIEILQNVATGAGMSGVDVEKFLHSTTGLDEVNEEEMNTRELAAGSGVPTFIIQRVHRLDGAHDPLDFYEAFVKVKEADTTHNI